MDLILLAGLCTALLLILELYDLVCESRPRPFTSTRYQRLPIARSASRAFDTQTIPVTPRSAAGPYDDAQGASMTI